MKKIFAGILPIILAFSLWGCKEDVIFRERYPGAVISRVKEGYEVVCDSIKGPNVIDQTSYYDLDERISYDAWKDLFSTLRLTDDAIFLGKKTGDAKQVIKLTAKGMHTGPMRTYSQVAVTESFYGDVKPGDTVLLKEDYAVYVDNKGQAYRIGHRPLTDELYIFIVHRDATAETPYGTGCWYTNCYPDDAVDVSRYAPLSLPTVDGYGISWDIYQQYAVRNETALDRAVETRKVLEWKRELASRKYDLTSKDFCKRYDAILENANSEALAQLLEEEEAALLERCFTRYGVQ